MSDIKLNVNPVGQDLVDQLRQQVPVRTGRLRKSIKYQVMDMNIVEFFNLAVFNMDWNDFQEKQIKKMTKK